MVTSNQPNSNGNFAFSMEMDFDAAPPFPFRRRTAASGSYLSRPVLPPFESPLLLFCSCFSGLLLLVAAFLAFGIGIGVGVGSGGISVSAFDWGSGVHRLQRGNLCLTFRLLQLLLGADHSYDYDDNQDNEHNSTHNQTNLEVGQARICCCACGCTRCCDSRGSLLSRSDYRSEFCWDYNHGEISQRKRQIRGCCRIGYCCVVKGVAERVRLAGAREEDIHVHTSAVGCNFHSRCWERIAIVESRRKKCQEH